MREDWVKWSESSNRPNIECRWKKKQKQESRHERKRIEFLFRTIFIIIKWIVKLKTESKTIKSWTPTASSSPSHHRTIFTPWIMLTWSPKWLKLSIYPHKIDSIWPGCKWTIEIFRLKFMFGQRIASHSNHFSHFTCNEYEKPIWSSRLDNVCD